MARIGMVIEALKKGHDVRRPGLYLVPTAEAGLNGTTYHRHALVRDGDSLRDWHPTQEDVYAEDWEVVPPPARG
jgi:hypothetical protein